MKLINEKYRTLLPTIGHLTDSVIMSQAWKKTHAYMRTHNWYADTLALDISALGLESNVDGWAEALRSSDSRPYDLEFIPAAKSEKWIVDENKGWIPESINDQNHVRNEKPPLRPLAHLTVRDQTWATAAMLCLADAVESAQGDCGGATAHQAIKNKVYSYGNRLICDWNDETKRAWFRWGNGETYRKFFSDYQAFLKRPVEIGRSVAKSQSEEEHVYVVSLDITKFYDSIDRSVLIQRLFDISTNFHEIVADDEFWSALRRILGWRWRDCDHARASDLSLQLTDGLPQGLVASGFFANAYLLNFDSAIGRCCGKELSLGSGVILHDYCRYVDDLRLVVTTEYDLDTQEVREAVHGWVSDKLNRIGGSGLHLNEGKTQVTALSDLDNKGSLSERVKSLQGDISGPADRDTLENVMGVLEGLLSMQTDSIPSATENQVDNALLKLAKYDHDVRGDTLKRFAANRLEIVMRNKRKLSGDVGTDGNTNLLDNESELLAKKLVWAWMQDPSLALVLRKALEIYPSTDIAEPVFESIFHRVSFGGRGNQVVDAITSAQADYLLADLFRSCVDFHGFFQRVEYPETSDPDAVLDMASRYALKTVTAENVPEFVERQALLLLAVLGRPVHNIQEVDNNQIHWVLHKILSGASVNPQRQHLALYEVVAQITGNNNAVASLLAEHMKQADFTLKNRMVEEFAKRGGEFWLGLWKHLKRDKNNDGLLAGFRWAVPDTGGEPSVFVAQRLSKIIESDVNGFVHESALLNLAISLIRGLRNGDLSPGLAPRQLMIKKDRRQSTRNWSELWRLGAIVECKKVRDELIDPRFRTPAWINEDLTDAEGIYWIGMILRSAAVGSNDYTSGRWKKGKVVGYKGLRTGWYKRRMGMMHAPEALVGEFSTVSDWTAELIQRCLQWPGFESTYLAHNDIAAIDSLDSFEEVLKKRLDSLNAMYCSASDMPGLVSHVHRPRESTNREFRLVTVQQLLPRTSDFAATDPQLDSTNIKRRNRDHLARLCLLTYKTLEAKIRADREIDRAYADLIVFSEVSVHIDDVDLIKRLADKTRSMILVGLIFTDHKGELVNIARWFIPDYRDSGRQWIVRDQGKQFPTTIELAYGVKGYRPCQHFIDVRDFEEGSYRITAAICYDATDLRLASDLKGKSDLFVVLAHNRDVGTFDTMASALHYHMYQHVVVVNKGEFGGSTIQAPYKQHFERLISHAHGSDQISINVADLDLAAFRRKRNEKLKDVKTKPAGL